MKFAAAVCFSAALLYLYLFVQGGFTGPLYAATLLVCAGSLVLVFGQPVPKPLWFRNKKYGYGSFPATWQGWITVVVATTLLISIALLADSTSVSPADEALTLIPFMVVVVTTLIAITIRTGEKWEWKWGKKR